MSSQPLTQIAGVMTGSALEEQQQAAEQSSWSLEELGGRLVELRGVGPAACLSAAFRVVLDAQAAHEPVAWICAVESMFFPEDASRLGVDLSSLPVVFAREPQQAAIMADKLVRSGAFGLLVIDLGEEPWFPEALQKRLAHYAEEQHTAIVCLTESRRDARTLGSLISLRVEVSRGDGRFSIQATRDRRRRPGWQHVEEIRGTVGMR